MKLLILLTLANIVFSKKNKKETIKVDEIIKPIVETTEKPKFPVQRPHHYFGEIPLEFQDQVCPQYFHYVSGTCQRNECSCEAGVRATNCTKHEAESCESCQEFFLLTTDETSGLSTCNLFCPEFYHQNNSTCNRNYCSCNNGHVEENCFEDGQESCRSCFQYYSIFKNDKTGANNCRLNCPIGYRVTDDGFSCQPNVCSCEGGWPATGKNCAVDATENCGKCFLHRDLVAIDESSDSNQRRCQLNCPEFWHEDNGMCQENRCYCRGGRVSENCTEHDSQQCQKGTCSKGYNELTDDNGLTICQLTCASNQHLSEDGNSCQQNHCICENGQAAHNKCWWNGASKCVNCYYGYYLSDDACVKKECNCENGIARDICDVHREGDQCAECDKGYVMDNDSCVINPVSRE